MSEKLVVRFSDGTERPFVSMSQARRVSSQKGLGVRGFELLALKPEECIPTEGPQSDSPDGVDEQSER